MRLTLAGLYAGLLLPSVLDRSTARVQEATRRGDALGRFRVHQEHMGAGHVLRKREAVLLPHRHHQ